MAKPPSDAPIVPLTLTAPAALRMIREIARDTGRIVTPTRGHGQKRMRQRRINRRQVELCLQKGTIQEGPFVNHHGNWQVSMYRHAADEEMTCAVAIEWAERLLTVITVMPQRRRTR